MRSKDRARLRTVASPPARDPASGRRRPRTVPREENRKPAPVWQNRCGSTARSPVTVGGPTGPSAQELKYECGRLIRLGKHRDSGLLKNLRADKLTHA